MSRSDYECLLFNGLLLYLSREGFETLPEQDSVDLKQYWQITTQTSCCRGWECQSKQESEVSVSFSIYSPVKSCQGRSQISFFDILLDLCQTEQTTKQSHIDRVKTTRLDPKPNANSSFLIPRCTSMFERVWCVLVSDHSRSEESVCQSMRVGSVKDVGYVLEEKERVLEVNDEVEVSQMET